MMNIKTIASVAILLISGSVSAMPTIEGNTITLPNDGDRWKVYDLGAGMNVCRTWVGEFVCVVDPGRYQIRNLATDYRLVVTIQNNDVDPPVDPDPPGGMHLGDLSCASGEFAQFTGSDWQCAAGAQGPQGVAGPAGMPGPAGMNGMDGADAPDRTAALCDLYQVLFDQSLIGSLAIPAFCSMEYSIGGEGPAGGIVFYLDETGGGLEAAPADQGSAEWGCGDPETEISGADGTAVGTGQQNTADILVGCAERPIAASVADDYILGEYDDWYLPSIDELREMDVNIGPGGDGSNEGGFISHFYWSSSEYLTFAWMWNFGQPDGDHNEFKWDTFIVRPVREF